MSEISMPRLSVVGYAGVVAPDEVVLLGTVRKLGSAAAFVEATA
jgi:hypothetical protein